MDILRTSNHPAESAWRPVKEGGSMAYRSTRHLKEELARLEEELEAARSLEHATAERHAREDTPETEAVLEARRTQAEHLAKKRDGLVGEIRRRAVEEMGWAPDGVEGPQADGASSGCGRAGRLRIGPHPLLPERGYILHDRVDATVAWVREVPSPALAAQLLAKHGVEWEGELLSHNLSPVPVEEQQRRR
jgi:hypothetical protein